MEKIKIMLIEDHNVFREGLKKLLELEDSMQVVAEAGSCEEALAKLSGDIDVILLDIGLPDGDGLELAGKIKQKYPHIKHVALTTYDDPIFIKKAMECGVKGFVPKYAFFDEIKSAVLMTYKGGSYLYPGLNTDSLLNLSDTGLMEKEIQILQLLARGKNQKEIAADLYISLSTFRRRLKDIFAKLNVHSVEEALTAAVKRGIIK
ncbi:response regulator transcription factor [Desulforamulus putei]|uniref:Stage 0 sporulation protein A homolog n=1 Tax=Desulforamulus putei DSM 12395 TaxID=1121429 RepID=A0A1M4T5C8_9FIRM|nr:response regulator transcription factor [Desulforamulus putei]SHE39611.1 two component transcriptional regulator, LuxR family [Desulforamulus putei DSM 12395]